MADRHAGYSDLFDEKIPILEQCFYRSRGSPVRSDSGKRHHL